MLGNGETDWSLHAVNDVGPWRNNSVYDRQPALTKITVWGRDSWFKKHISWHIIYADWHLAGRRTGWGRILCWVTHLLCPCSKKGRETFQEELGHPNFSKLCQILNSLSWVTGPKIKSASIHLDEGCTTRGLTNLRIHVAGSLLSSMGNSYQTFFPRSIPSTLSLKEVPEMKPNPILKPIVPSDRNHTVTSDNHSCAKQAISFSIPGGGDPPLIFILNFFLTSACCYMWDKRADGYAYLSEPDPCSVIWSILWRHCLF